MRTPEESSATDDGAPRARPRGESGAGIEETAGVCGGEPRISGTRIPVWTLEQSRHLGMSEADILRAYPSLRPVDLANAWIYASTHRGEIDRQIRENEEA
jgi:uncharacterized protein (DUF433 family)